jgi:hypothetical protein
MAIPPIPPMVKWLGEIKLCAANETRAAEISKNKKVEQIYLFTLYFNSYFKLIYYF